MEQSIPEGYRMQICEGLGLTLPVPVDWAVWRLPQGQEYCIAKGVVSLGDEVTYETGLSLGIIRDLHSSYTPEKAARRFIELSNDLTPADDIGMTEERRGPFVTFQQTFTAIGEVMGLAGVERALLVCGIGYEALNVVYAATFETPLDQWEQHRRIARIMIGGIQPLKGMA